MKTFLLAMTAIPALAIATPAAAQYYRSNADAYGNAAFTQRIDQLRARLDAGIRARTISAFEARSLRAQLWQLQRLHRQYAANGLTRTERDVLRDRISNLRGDIRIADNGSWDRYDRYAYNDGYWGDTRYYGRGGPDEDNDGVCIRRGGIGGLIERIFENDDDCLRVGERARTELLPVPVNYRNRYRDRSDVYFRSDGDRIYEIDVRSNRVIAVHPM